MSVACDGEPSVTVSLVWRLALCDGQPSVTVSPVCACPRDKEDRGGAGRHGRCRQTRAGGGSRTHLESQTSSEKCGHQQENQYIGPSAGYLSTHGSRPLNEPECLLLTIDFWTLISPHSSSKSKTLICYWLLNVDSWLLSPEYWLPNSDSNNSSLKYWLLSNEFWILTLQYWFLNINSWILALDFSLFDNNSNIYFWISSPEHWLLSNDSWIKTPEYWFLNTDSWTLTPE